MNTNQKKASVYFFTSASYFATIPFTLIHNDFAWTIVLLFALGLTVLSTTYILEDLN